MRMKMKESLYPNCFRRFLLPLVAVCVLMLFCTGCVTRSVIYELGTTNTAFTDHIFMPSYGAWRN